ncbi:sensor histidine kinase [Pedobacter metabolipauper]|uniref:sensor histidine kinase n=1 Tax=Pedobacter metabolipauper TaxID=425513 RepID=UPI00105D428E|nr:histidine kinase [Pedobacter metabolipauper]
MLKKSALTFPVVFELLIWLFYVSIYKYSYYLDIAHLPHIPDNDLPYLQICLYSICSTLYVVPYYRWAVPNLLHHKKYGWLFLLTLIYFIFLTVINNMAIAWIFEKFTEIPVQKFFHNRSLGVAMDLNIILTDSIAFLSIAFSRFSYQNEMKRHQVETDNLQLQLNMLKAQLQPHFLFNTLNSLYGLSITGSKDTPRFILLLSQMMQYILYDCDQEAVDLKEELVFLQGYFELEQKKFPNASIFLKIPEQVPSIKIPPLLFLPLVENSFKHGRHKLENDAGVYAEFSIVNNQLTFKIENETLSMNSTLMKKNTRGGIGLVNIKKRLELYYPNRNQLLLHETNDKYTAELILKLT